MGDKTKEMFGSAPVAKAVLSNVIPSMISMLMVMVYNLADTFFIGQTHNPYMLAGISVATPAFLIFMAIGMVFGIGGTSLISRRLGEGRKQAAKNASSFCFWTGFCVGVVSAVLVVIFAEPICWAVGASADTIEYAVTYLRIVGVCIPFLIVSNSFSHIIRAEGEAQAAMTGMVGGNLVNIILDPIMILGLRWTVAGAAVATVFGNLFSAGYYLYRLTRKSKLLSIRPTDYRIGDGIAIGIFAIGVPASLNNILMSLSNILVNNLMAQYNDMAVAGLGVAMKVNMIVVMLLIGLGIGIQPLLGYCFGAGKKERYMAVLRFSACLAFGVSLVMTVICYTGAEFLVRAFLTDDAAFAYGFEFSRTYIYAGPIIGIMFVFVNAIQSMGAALPALILNISRQGLVYIPVLFLFRKIFDTPRMIAAAQPVTDYAAAILAISLFFLTFRRYFKRQQEKLTGNNL